MERFLDLLFAFAKDNGVGVSIPITIWVVIKVMLEDRKEKKEATEKNHDDIHGLELRMARIEAKQEALEKAVY